MGSTATVDLSASFASGRLDWRNARLAQLVYTVSSVRGVRSVLASKGGRHGRVSSRAWSYPFQIWLAWASYFNGGIAFHEYPDVPTLAASHGCVRIPQYWSQLLYRFAPIGTPVRVLTRSL